MECIDEVREWFNSNPGEEISPSQLTHAMGNKFKYVTICRACKQLHEQGILEYEEDEKTPITKKIYRRVPLE